MDRRRVEEKALTFFNERYDLSPLRRLRTTKGERELEVCAAD
jgi:hypothetical protein